jgi:LysR family glycine cleavage system transcriptional activator
MADSAHNTPSLDLLRGFEAAARHLNFTRAAGELFITQSAVSRQIKALEERLDVPLFVRQRKGLRLTAAGERLYRAVSSALRQVNEAMEGLSQRDAALVTVTSTMSFCSLWLIPRLVQFNKSHPEVRVRIAANDRVLNLERERIDVSVRYCTPDAAPKGATWLFDEELLPVCSPALLDVPGRPLREPTDLKRHVLLHLDDPDNPSAWLSWRTWLDAAGVGSLKASGSLVFNYFEQMTRAALAGSGVALGRTVLVQDLLEDGSLVAPFPQRVRTERGYCLVEAAQARGRTEVAQFAQWLVETATSDKGGRLGAQERLPARSGRAKRSANLK